MTLVIILVFVAAVALMVVAAPRIARRYNDPGLARLVIRVCIAVIAAIIIGALTVDDILENERDTQDDLEHLITDEVAEEDEEDFAACARTNEVRRDTRDAHERTLQNAQAALADAEDNPPDRFDPGILDSYDIQPPETKELLLEITERDYFGDVAEHEVLVKRLTEERDAEQLEYETYVETAPILDCDEDGTAGDRDDFPTTPDRETGD